MSHSYELRLFDHDDVGDYREDRFTVRNEPAGDYFAAVPVDASLGWVGVDRTGTLTGVEPDGPTMARMPQDRVAGLLIAAINQAELTARRHLRP
ncbi:hypothetical protein [Actinophytocola sp.]|uniref:hypothetical protein n=1 Tax=Actinophytocola sp. TaxID=1872138 RepID=UPI003D6ADAEE